MFPNTETDGLDIVRSAVGSSVPMPTFPPFRKDLPLAVIPTLAVVVLISNSLKPPLSELPDSHGVPAKIATGSALNLTFTPSEELQLMPPVTSSACG